MKAIIFDMDGLMVDTERLYFETEREIAKEYGKTVEDSTLWKMMGMSPHESIKIYINDLGLTESPDKLLKKREEMMYLKYKNDLVVMNGLFEMLDEFYQKKMMAISTGAPKKFMDIVVENLNIKKYFNVLQPCDEIKNGKPDPEIYLKTIEKLGLKPEECIVLEDSSNGSLAGKKAGCYTIAVETIYTKGQDFSFVDFYAKDLHEAREHIRIL